MQSCSWDFKSFSSEFSFSVSVIFKSSLKNESFEKDLTFMNNIEELQEASLEKLISDSLVEAYGNVAGFKLTNCAYLNEAFTLDGTIYFNSGNIRETTYKFTEACDNKNDKIKLRGLNEKLGLDKQFTLTGNIDTATKTFIAESFSIYFRYSLNVVAPIT